MRGLIRIVKTTEFRSDFFTYLAQAEKGDPVAIAQARTIVALMTSIHHSPKKVRMSRWWKTAKIPDAEGRPYGWREATFVRDNLAATIRHVLEPNLLFVTTIRNGLPQPVAMLWPLKSLPQDDDRRLIAALEEAVERHPHPRGWIAEMSDR